MKTSKIQSQCKDQSRQGFLKIFFGLVLTILSVLVVEGITLTDDLPSAEPPPQTGLSPATLVGNSFEDIARKAEFQDDIIREIEKLPETKKIKNKLIEKLGNLKEEKKNALIFELLDRNSNIENDFETNHREMLARLRDCKELIVKLDALRSEILATISPLNKLEGYTGETEPKLNELIAVRESLVATHREVEGHLGEAKKYQKNIENLISSETYRYGLKLGFRKYVGLIWITVFSVIFGLITWLLAADKLSVPPGGTLQFVAVILIIFVVIFFGLTDIMGENGVTGLLAAIAGYILGKSGEDIGHVLTKIFSHDNQTGEIKEVVEKINDKIKQRDEAKAQLDELEKDSPEDQGEKEQRAIEAAELDYKAKAAEVTKLKKILDNLS